MPLQTQHPARRRQRHSEAPVIHQHAVRKHHAWLDEVKSKSRKDAEAERIQRRDERQLVRAAKHAAVVSPPGLNAHLEQKRMLRVEAERARAHTSHERELKRQRRLRRRSPEYYATWTERLMRYVHRRLRRGKRLSTRVLAALNRTRNNLAA